MRFLWVYLGLYAYACAQNVPPNTDFNDLARRASAALATDPKRAVDLSREALKLNPSWAEGWFNVGAGLYQSGQYPESRQAFEEAGKLAPQKGAVWAFLGLCEYQLGDFSTALAHIQRAESLGLPDNSDFVATVRNRAALICIRARDFSAAIEQLKPLALLGDNSKATIEAFGVSALGMPHLPADVPVTKKHLVELAGRAEWSMAADRDGEAAAQLQQLLSQYPHEPGVHYLNAIYLVAHDPEAARREFDSELQINPSNVAARLQIAILELRSGDAASAVVLGRDAVRAQPDNALAHAVLGRAYMQLEQFDKAVPELQNAAKLAPLNPQLHLYLQQAYARLGKMPEAEKEKAEFLRLRSAGRESSGEPDLQKPPGARK